MTAENHQGSRTQGRLLEAAGEVFAEQGFRAATVREICERAKANIAAVNYHFGDKEGLYTAVLQYAHAYAVQKYPPLLGLSEDAPAEERLCAFVHAFLLRILDEGRPAWHGKLMAREVIEPTTALDTLVEQAFRPQFERLMAIMKDLLGSDACPAQVYLCASSIVGQCLFYHHARPVLMRVNPQQRYDADAIGRLAEHITRFSLGGLRILSRRSEGEPE
jgi:TetR/AcrR family transcriptional regulator, regulator of cefoperazone and chloramphenicol sensitivity